MTKQMRMWVLAACTVIASGCAKSGSPGASYPDPYDSSPEPAATVAPAKAGAKGPTAAAPKPLGPVGERAAAFREAASLLEKAATQLAAGNRSFAEQLFSTAEILVGIPVLADLAPSFREGAPPRMDTPYAQMTDTGKQPMMVGNSDEDEPETTPQAGSLTGMVMVDGRAGAGLGVVTLEPLDRKAKRRTPKQRIIEQRDRQFMPRVLAVPVGSTVLFPNYDGVFHNVFSSSEVKAFDLGLYKNGQARSVNFDHEGVVRLGCNLHANMSAFVIVVAAPHYAITDDKGNFKFGNLVPGRYRMKVWNERSLAPMVQEVVVKPGKNQLSLGMKGDAPAGPMPDKFGVSRDGKK